VFSVDYLSSSSKNLKWISMTARPISATICRLIMAQGWSVDIRGRQIIKTPFRAFIKRTKAVKAVWTIASLVKKSQRLTWLTERYIWDLGAEPTSCCSTEMPSNYVVSYDLDLGMHSNGENPAHKGASGVARIGDLSLVVRYLGQVNSNTFEFHITVKI